MQTLADKSLTCRDCRNDFVFTSGEQEFYAEKGFTNAPGRCPDCRRAAKAARVGGNTAYRGGGGFAPRGERTMYPATCDACGKDTEIPFAPTSGKPVYCSDCFRSQREQRRYSSW